MYRDWKILVIIVLLMLGCGSVFGYAEEDKTPVQAMHKYSIYSMTVEGITEIVRGALPRNADDAMINLAWDLLPEVDRSVREDMSTGKVKVHNWKDFKDAVKERLRQMVYQKYRNNQHKLLNKKFRNRHMFDRLSSEMKKKIKDRLRTRSSQLSY